MIKNWCGSLWEYSDGLRDLGVAHWALRVVELTDSDGTLHAEEVMATGHQGSRHFAFKAGHAVPHSGRRRVWHRQTAWETFASWGGLAVGAAGLGVRWAGYGHNAGDWRVVGASSSTRLG